MGVKTAKSDDEYKQLNRDRDIYSDFNHTFLPHPYTNQISRKTNVDAVKMSIRNLILTNKYERLRNPDFGGNITKYLFEPFDDVITQEIETHIEQLVERYEPRVRLLEVKVTANEEQNMINVNIFFSVLSTQTDASLDITLYRVR